MRKLLFFIFFLFFSKLNAVEFKGKFIQGHYIIGKTDPNAKILIDKNEVKVSDQGYFVFGLNKNRKNDVLIEVIKNNIKNYGKVKNYFVENIEELQCINSPTKSFAKVMGNSFWNITEKTISFSYFGKLIVFGIQLNNKESKKIVTIITTHLRKTA